MGITEEKIKELLEKIPQTVLRELAHFSLWFAEASEQRESLDGTLFGYLNCLCAMNVLDSRKERSILLKWLEEQDRSVEIREILKEREN